MRGSMGIKRYGRKQILFVMVIVWFLLNCVFLIGYVPTESMEPTLKKDSLIIGIRIYPELLVGDIIILEHGGQLMVKRIAAVEGDMVERNGICMTIPEDCYYVLGDNEENSLDSRYWEEPFVRVRDVVAKLILISAGPKRGKTKKTPEGCIETKTVDKVCILV